MSRIAKTVSFNEETVRRIEHYMAENHIETFSSAVHQLLNKAMPPMPEELRKAMLEEYQARRREERQRRIAEERAKDISLNESCPNCGSREGFVRFASGKARCDMCMWYEE